MIDEPSLDWAEGAAVPAEGATLVVMLTGWIDATGAAAATMRAIADEIHAEVVAVFDHDTYIDFRARRPLMQVREGLNTMLESEHITLSVGTDQAGHDLLLLRGPEPDMAWNRFCSIMGNVASTLRIGQMIGLGAYPFTTPHTRPSRLSITSPSPDVLAAVPMLRSSVDVPAGAVSMLEHTLHGLDIPSMTLWAQVPHYVSNGSYPPASVALIDALRQASDIIVDATDLRQAAVDSHNRLDELVSANPEHLRLLRQLEQLHDQTADTDESGVGTAGGPGLEWASGDEIADELERFLRDQQ